MVAVLSTVKGEAVAQKATEEEPAGTVTEAGTDRAVLLVERATTVPPAWIVMEPSVVVTLVSVTPSVSVMRILPALDTVALTDVTVV